MTAKYEGVKGLRPGWVGEPLRSSFFTLFTRVRGRRILGSSRAGGSLLVGLS
jgi:hypothetical protein